MGLMTKLVKHMFSLSSRHNQCLVFTTPLTVYEWFLISTFATQENLSFTCWNANMTMWELLLIAAFFFCFWDNVQNSLPPKKLQNLFPPTSPDYSCTSLPLVSSTLTTLKHLQLKKLNTHLWAQIPHPCKFFPDLSVSHCFLFQPPLLALPVTYL